MRKQVAGDEDEKCKYMYTQISFSEGSRLDEGFSSGDQRKDSTLAAVWAESYETSIKWYCKVFFRDLLWNLGKLLEEEETKTIKYLSFIWLQRDMEYAYYQLCHGPADAPPTPPLYLHLPDESWRSGSWSMPTTNYLYTQSYSLNVF